jgi:hypothetical protein
MLFETHLMVVADDQDVATLVEPVSAQASAPSAEIGGPVDIDFEFQGVERHTVDVDLGIAASTSARSGGSCLNWPTPD